MTPPIVFPDAVDLVLSYLADALPDYGETVDVGNHVPNPRPTPFLLARRVGGPRLHLVADDASIAFEIWHATPEQAQDLAQLARALVISLAGRSVQSTPVYRVAEIGGLADLPDPLSNQPRYVFTLGVALRGAVRSGS